jgi:RNA polymerase sigma factor (sigma-70 family)
LSTKKILLQFPSFCIVCSLYNKQVKFHDEIQNIIAKASGGDAAAQRSLYENFGKAMYNVCLRMVEKREVAEDILQDAFIIAFKSLSKLRNSSLFAAWLKRIVINECIKSIKKDVRWYSLETASIETFDNEKSDWFHQIDAALIFKEIAKLPYGCKQIFSLYVIEDYSHKEIADMLGISESTSKSQYQRARILLKHNLIKIVENNGFF